MRRDCGTNDTEVVRCSPGNVNKKGIEPFEIGLGVSRRRDLSNSWNYLIVEDERKTKRKNDTLLSKVLS